MLTRGIIIPITVLILAVVGESAGANECDSVLAQQSTVIKSMSSANAVYILDLVNDRNYEQAKHDASGSGDYYEVIKGSASYSDFTERRRNYFSKHQYTSNTSNAENYVKQEFQAAVYPSWVQCVLATAKYGLTITPYVTSSESAYFAVIWRPTFVHQPSKVTDSYVSGGVVHGAKPGEVYRRNYSLGYTDGFAVIRAKPDRGTVPALIGWIQVDQSAKEPFALPAIPPGPQHPPLLPLPPKASTGALYQIIFAAKPPLSLAATGKGTDRIDTRHLAVVSAGQQGDADLIFIIEKSQHNSVPGDINSDQTFYLRGGSGDPYVGPLNAAGRIIRLTVPEEAAKLHFVSLGQENVLRVGEPFVLKGDNDQSYVHVAGPAIITYGDRVGAAEFHLISVR